MFRKLFMGVAMAAVAVSASAQAETISIHGSTTVFANVFKANKAKIEKAAGVTLKVVSNGSGRGLADLSAGKADMGMISSDLAATVAKANKKRPGSVNPAGLTAHKLGETRVAFIVHPSNGVKTLTMDQVKAILSGQAKNWKDVGGNDKPIVIISEPTGGGIRSMVEKEVLSKASVKGTLRQVPNGTQVPLVVSQLP
ncbi:MAG: substrate-binding domain-containing protein, partial [Alphaproteobacteria bacterium]|nr:substrate-binding domain-containing protein [Alphaproteobacteria bacterium]